MADLSLREIAPFAVPFIKEIIKVWITPKLMELKKNWDTENCLFDHLFENKFSDYLERSYVRHSFMNTIVFSNQQIRIKDLYIPSNVISTKDKTKLSLTHYSDDFIPKYKHVLLTDTAGMGKSTALKWLFLSAIDQRKGIPIFVELRKLNAANPILSQIVRELNSLNNDLTEHFIVALIQRGDFIFFLDGFDEIPFSDREFVTRDLQDFINRADKNLFVLSSRPDPALASFSGFQEFRIQPLSKPEAHALIRKYDKNNKIADQIIAGLNAAGNSVDDFLGNPMLVSLLFLAFNYKQAIPIKKVLFYDQVFDALFERHDYTKDGGFNRPKLSGLDKVGFSTVLKSIGFKSLVQLGKIEYTQSELDSLVISAQKSTGLEFNANGFENDLRISVPLFIQDGAQTKWAHKSFQDYFAAQYVRFDAGGRSDEILEKMCKSENQSKYYSVLDLYFDLDIKGFRRAILRPILVAFIEECERAISKLEPLGLDKDQILKRTSLTFGKEIAFMVIPGIADYFKPNSGANRNIGELFALAQKVLKGRPRSMTRPLVEPIDLAIFHGEERIPAFLTLFDNRRIDVFTNLRPTLRTIVTTLSIEPKTPVLIECNENSPLCRPETFEEVNSILALVTDEPCLNYQKCVSMLKTIDDEIRSSTTDIDILSSI